MFTPDVVVILPAAGSGKRFGGSRNKIFALLRGEPIFLRTLDRFRTRADVGRILMPVTDADAREMCERFGEPLAAMNVRLLAGGANRTESVRNALRETDERLPLICVHDTVRPCVPSERIDAVFDEARRCGAAMLAWPVHATIKRVDAERNITETVCRDGLWQAQTPQVFRRELLLAAYDAADGPATDDAALVEALGRSVRIVPGDPRNLKITTPADLAFAEAVYDTLS